MMTIDRWMYCTYSTAIVFAGVCVMALGLSCFLFYFEGFPSFVIFCFTLPGIVLCFSLFDYLNSVHLFPISLPSLVHLNLRVPLILCQIIVPPCVHPFQHFPSNNLPSLIIDFTCFLTYMYIICNPFLVFSGVWVLRCLLRVIFLVYCFYQNNIPCWLLCF